MEHADGHLTEMIYPQFRRACGANRAPAVLSASSLNCRLRRSRLTRGPRLSCHLAGPELTGSGREHIAVMCQLDAVRVKGHYAITLRLVRQTSERTQPCRLIEHNMSIKQGKWVLASNLLVKNVCLIASCDA